MSKPTNKPIGLCAVPYRVTQCEDGRIVFADDSGLPGRSEFSIKWEGSGWYLVDVNTRWDRVYIPHLVAALKWCQSHYRVSYQNGKASVSDYQEETIPPEERQD